MTFNRISAANAFTTMESSATGMSRAAQKRAKKRKLKHPATVATVQSGKSLDYSAALGYDPNGIGTALSSKPFEETTGSNKKRKKSRIDDRIGEDDKEDHDVDDGTDQDEEVEMKSPAEIVLDDEMLDDSVFDDCSRVYDFLLLPEPHKGNSGDDNRIAQSPLLKEEGGAHTLTIRQRARGALSFLLKPSMTVAEFYKTYWEKKPVHISSPPNGAQQHRHRLDGLLSLESIRQILETNKVSYGKDINVTRYETCVDNDGTTTQRRITLDKLSSGVDDFAVARPTDVWRHWDDGCTIRLLCPHQHSNPVHALLSLLEWEWGCMVGANAYLTPPNAAQGFAPHYDDIDAYCLQLQGRKRWKVYAPIRSEERLPRVSSTDYTAADMRDETPVLDVILEPGDVLYMPRGWIHQACTLPFQDNAHEGKDSEQHSLHLTVSSMQQWAWADLLEILFPEALEATISGTATTMRLGLPPRFLDYMGATHDNREENVPAILQQKLLSDCGHGSQINSGDDKCMRALQDAFRAQAKRRIMRVAKEAIDMLDAACDQMGKRFLSDRLPPLWTSQEVSETNQSDGHSQAHVSNKNHLRGKRSTQIQPHTLCRLVRPGVARLVLEQSMAVVYHCLENSVVYHEHPLTPLEFEMDDAPALEQLLTTIAPHWIAVEDLIHDSIDDKIGVAQALYDEGLLAHRSNLSDL